MLHLKTARLARWQIRLLAWSGAILWSSGIAWLLLHRFGEIQTDFGVEANPAEPWLLRLHGAAMVAALLGTGSLLVVHVWRGWQYRHQRVAGLTLAAISALLVISGYLLYYVGDDVARSWTSRIHWIIGIAALPSFLWHYRRGRAAPHPRQPR